MLKEEEKENKSGDVRFCIRLPADLREDLREAHQYVGGRESDIIRKALRLYLAELKKDSKDYEEAQKKLKQIFEEL